MLTASYIGNGEIRIAAAEPAPPQPSDVQIAVAYTGLCGTDLHIIHGSMDERVSRPLVFGHEMSGTIAALGDDVVGWRVGDPVTVMPLQWDGTCPACLDGNSHICHNLNFIGIDSPGSLQGLWNVPAATLVALPAGLRLDHAALVEPTAVAVHDVRRASLVPGEKAVVIGGGPIGVLIATVAREFGADVVVLETDPRRRASAAQLGFKVLDPAAHSPEGWVTAWTGGSGADVVFEVSGAAAAVSLATQLAKVRGRLVVVAIHPTPREVDLKRVFWRELTLIGARVYDRSDFEAAVDLLDQGVIPADLLISRVVTMQETQDAIEDLQSGRAMKILVNIGGSV